MNGRPGRDREDHDGRLLRGARCGSHGRRHGLRTVRGFWLGMVLAAVGCGYTQRSLFPDAGRLIAVHVFDNDTFYRELEFALTDQVVRELQRRQGVSVVGEERAQLILRGRITSVEQRVLAEDERDRPRETGATTTVQISLLDVATGKVVKTATVRDRAEFVRARGETLLTAQSESFTDLARRIVYALEEGF